MNEKDLTEMESGLTLMQRVAICFAAGVIGGLAVVLFSHVLFGLGLSATFGAVPLRFFLLPRAGAGAVYNLPADERRGVFRASAGRADVHALSAAGKYAVRNNHCFDRQGDNREKAVSRLHIYGIPPEVNGEEGLK